MARTSVTRTVGGSGAERPRFIVYLRVSTRQQGVSGLGLDAQRETVERYIRSVGGEEKGRVVEVESGRKSSRVGLDEALRQCRVYRAALLIAKLDRLARNVLFTATLMESKVDFVACDMPEANALTIHIMAAMAEHEAKAISARTKAALAQAKLRGTKLGGVREGVVSVNDATRAKAAARVRQKGNDDAIRVGGTIQEIRRAGHVSLSAMSAELNRLGVATPRGGAWTATSVRNVMLRLKAMAEAAGPGFDRWEETSPPGRGAGAPAPVP